MLVSGTKGKWEISTSLSKVDPQIELIIPHVVFRGSHMLVSGTKGKWEISTSLSKVDRKLFLRSGNGVLTAAD
jgi:hypothetical protein